MIVICRGYPPPQGCTHRHHVEAEYDHFGRVQPTLARMPVVDEGQLISLMKVS